MDREPDREPSKTEFPEAAFPLDGSFRALKSRQLSGERYVGCGARSAFGGKAAYRHIAVLQVGYQACRRRTKRRCTTLAAYTLEAYSAGMVFVELTPFVRFREQNRTDDEFRALQRFLLLSPAAGDASAAPTDCESCAGRRPGGGSAAARALSITSRFRRTASTLFMAT